MSLIWQKFLPVEYIHNHTLFPISSLNNTHEPIGNTHHFGSYLSSILLRIPNYAHVHSLTCLRPHRVCGPEQVTIQCSCRTAGLTAPIASPQGGMLPSLCSAPLPDLFISLALAAATSCYLSAPFRPLHTICRALLLLMSCGLLIPYHLYVQYCLRYCFLYSDNLGYKAPQPPFFSTAERKLSSLCPVLLGWVPTAECLVPYVVISRLYVVLQVHVITKHVTVVL